MFFDYKQLKFEYVKEGKYNRYMCELISPGAKSFL